MSLEKAKIGDSIYDVISLEEFYSDPQASNSCVAIKGNDGYIYPIRNRNDSRPGFYPTGGLDFFKPPLPGEYNTYTQQNTINFQDATGIRDIIKCQQKLINAERSILTTIDSVYAPEIGPNDTPEMQALKQAIIDKYIDIDKYEPRFGPNFNNDKRLLKKSSITFGKLRSVCNALDIKVSIVIEDASPDVPNPIGKVITTEITETGMSIDEGSDNT